MDKAKPWYNSWPILATVLFISCIGILVRKNLVIMRNGLNLFRRYVPVSGLLSYLRGSMVLSRHLNHCSMD